MSGPQWDVIGIGESSIDEVFRLPGVLRPNVKLPVSSRQIRYGGQVATTLATCASFGLRTAVAALGDFQTGGVTAENVVANFWSVGAAIVIR